MKMLVTRVHNLVPEGRWSKRYKDINNFEKLLHQNGNHYAKILPVYQPEGANQTPAGSVDDKDKAWKILYQRFRRSANIGMISKKAYEDAFKPM